MLKVAFQNVVIFLCGKSENILIVQLADLQLVGLARALLLHVDTADTHTHTLVRLILYDNNNFLF